MPGKIALLILLLLIAAGGGTWWLVSQNPSSSPEQQPAVTSLEQTPSEPAPEVSTEEPTEEPTEEQAEAAEPQAVEPESAEPEAGESDSPEAAESQIASPETPVAETPVAETPVAETPVEEAPTEAPVEVVESDAQTAPASQASQEQMADGQAADGQQPAAGFEATTVAEAPASEDETAVAATGLAEAAPIETAASEATTENTDQVVAESSSPAVMETSSPAVMETSSPAVMETSSPAVMETSSPAVMETADQTQVPAESDTAAIEPSTKTPATETPVTETAVAEAPAVEAPAVETPVAVTPVAEMPVVEAPSTETAATETSTTTAPEAEIQQANAQPANTQPADGQPADRQLTDAQETGLDSLQGLSNLLDAFQISETETQAKFGDAGLTTEGQSPTSAQTTDAAASTLEGSELAKADTATPAPDLPKSQGSFDVIRLDASGKAVLAGSSNRLATSLLLNGELVESLSVSDSGQWSYITETPLPNGSVTFALAVRDPATGGFEEPYMAVAALFIEAPQAAPAVAQPVIEETQVAATPTSEEPVAPASEPVAQAAVEPQTGEPTAEPAPELAVATTPAQKASPAATTEPVTVQTDQTDQASADTGNVLSEEQAAAVQNVAEQLVAKADSQHEAPAASQVTTAQPDPKTNQVKLLAVSQSAGDTQFRVHSAQLSGAKRDGQLYLERLDYDSFGNLVLNGQAQPAHSINIYLDNQLIGQPDVRRDQRWSHAPKNFQCPPGQHTIRTDMVDGQGNVVARLELPFVREETSWDTEGKVDLTIKRNDNLWRIASRAFGKGAKYTLIYANNNDQISDPNLIYPGQVFEIRREN